MTPERLLEIKTMHAEWLTADWRGYDRPVLAIKLTTVLPELFAHVAELTRQLDDARTKAIDAGIFTSTDGDQSRYTHALNTDTCENCGESFGLHGDYCVACDLETSTPGATSYKP